MSTPDPMSPSAKPDPSPVQYDTQQFANVVSAVRDLKHPKQIGPYSIQAVIGEGGMGTVYRAQQREPINRTVAIKIIKLGMDTREVIARFESERQALALMNHTHVAKVLDAGATETGRPYFVMEYFKGEPITAYADRHKLTVRERLELFMQACDAVQHAHHKAIIHRDLKPSNIIVTEEDGKPTVKVIDFGVAKALSQRLTEKTLFTTTGQLVGTPEYMAPEQAEANAPDVDTRSDVYSLGVVLYELLSGSLPFDPNTLRSVGYNEIQRIIREVDPPRPSTRLTRVGGGGEEVARCRQMSLELLTKQLKSELEWIPLKAMRKARGDRYASPTELAEDLQNYLANRPLRAGPESPAYRAHKFLRRNKRGVAVSAAMIFLLIAGIIATTWQAVRANREKRQAQYQEQQAILAKDNVREVNHFLTEDLLASASPEISRGKELTVREAVDRAAETIGERFKDRPATEAEVRAVLSDTYDSLGLPERSLSHAQAAYELFLRANGPTHETTINAKRLIGRQLSKLNRNTEAEPILRDAMAKCDQYLAKDNETTLATMVDLGGTLRRQRRFDEAEPYYRRAAELDRITYGRGSDEDANSLNGLAVLLADAGRDDEAEPLYREALEIRQKHGTDYPYYLTTLSNLARLIERRGRLAEAESMMREALDTRRRVLKDDHPSTLLAMNDLAGMAASLGRLEEAEALNREALTRRLRLFGPDDVDTLQSMNNLGRTLEMQGRYAEAEVVLRQCVEKRKRVLGETHPHTLSATINLVRACVKQKKWDEAEQLLRYLIQPQILKELAPGQQSSIYARLSTRLAEKKEFAEAEPMLLEAHRRTVEANYMDGRREVLASLAQLYEETNRPDKAAKYRAELASLPTTEPASQPAK